MALTTAGLNAAATGLADVITHIGLVDDLGDELSGGSYARLPVTWTAPADGAIAPNGNLAFDVPAASTVAGWRGFSALTAGTDYGGADLDPEAFTNAGTYTLLAASTGYDIDPAA